MHLKINSVNMSGSMNEKIWNQSHRRKTVFVRIKQQQLP